MSYPSAGITYVDLFIEITRDPFTASANFIACPVAFDIPLPAAASRLLKPFDKLVARDWRDADAAAYDAVTTDIESMLFCCSNILSLFALDISNA